MKFYWTVNAIQSARQEISEMQCAQLGHSKIDVDGFCMRCQLHPEAQARSMPHHWRRMLVAESAALGKFSFVQRKP